MALGGARQRSLLAALVVRANEVVSSDRLVDELWGEQPPGTATTALHGLVSQLRKALEPERPSGAAGSVLVTRFPGYVLRIDPGALDAARFEQLFGDGRDALDAGEASRAATLLRAALALWKGQAFSGADDAPLVHAEAMRLDELQLQALEERIDADLALGRDDDLVSELAALVEREPLRERLRGQLMLALYRSGRQADALALYQETRIMLAARLGIEPTPRLRELEQAILRQDPELDAGLPRLRPRAVLRQRRSRVLVVAGAVLLAVIAATAAVALTRGNDTPLQATPGSVAVIDPEAMRVVDTIPVGSGPAAIVYGHGSVWVANAEDGTVSRIDPQTHEVVRVIGAPSPVDLAIGVDAVWIASGIDGTVSRIDPKTNDVVAEIDLRGPDPTAPLTVQGVATGEGAAWASVGQKLVRIDVATNTVDKSVDVGAAALGAAVGHGSVWVVTAAERLLRIEPTSLAVTARTATGFPLDVEVADDGVVVLVRRPDYSRVDLWLADPDSARLERTLPVAGNPVGVSDVRGRRLWAVTLEGTATLIDVVSDAPRTPVSTGREPSSVAVGAGAVWVAIRDREP